MRLVARLTFVAALALRVGAAMAVLEPVAPPENAVVPLLRPEQADYLKAARAVRLRQMGDSAARLRLFKAGDTALPVILSWRGATGAVTLEIAPEGGSREVFVLTNGETTARLANLELARRYRWSVRANGETAGGSFVTADTPPRVLRAEGVGNFRDLGGWRTVDGRRVRQNAIFRSAGLRSSARSVGASMFAPRYEPGERRVTAAGLETLRDEFQVRTDLELRSRRECTGMDGTLLGEDVAWRHIPFVAYDFIDRLTVGKEAFCDIFQLFTERANYPILVHCSGGRDRTGTLAFLLNGLLGVAEDDLRRDWEFSLFSDPSPKFASARLERLTAYLAKLPGRTLQERIVFYCRTCGITEGQIAAFRAIMLEPKP